MDSLINIIEPILSSIGNFYTIATHFLIQYQLLISVVSIILLLLFRIVMANLLYVSRKDKQQWIIWGVLLVLQIIISFVKMANLWFVLQLGIYAVMIVYCMIFDQQRQLKTALYSNNMVFEDQSERYSNKGSSEGTEARKQRDSKLRRGWTFNRMHMKMKVPVLTVTYTFKLSPMATEEQLAKARSYLNRFYSDYNWRGNRKTDFYEISGEIKTNKINALGFDKELSDALDWYIVPLGAIDVSTKKTAKETPYVWMLHDPKTEGKTYKELEKTTLFTPAPQGFVVGQTGGGKSVLLNTIIAHWINKAKQNKQTELYLADAKRMEFRPYEKLEEVAGVAVTLEEAVELSDMFVDKMTERNVFMEQEGIKNIPLDGAVTLNKYIDINGKLIKKKEIVEIELNDGTIKKIKAGELDNRTDIKRINFPETEKEDEEKEYEPMW